MDDRCIIVEINLRAAEILATSRNALQGRDLSLCIHEDDRNAFQLSRKRVLERRSLQVCELRLLRINALPFWARLEMTVGQEGNERLSWIVIIDIHALKTTQESLEKELLRGAKAFRSLQAKDEELQRSLDEKETLVREVHHRVKNNLQVISSLLRMQADLVKDHDAKVALKESHHRIVSMAMIHERLYGEQQIDQIDFEEYTQTLLHELLVSYGDGTSRVTGRVEGAAVNLTVEQAIPCGLILNELVTNALKYAYPNGQSGDVVIYMEESPNGMVTLSVTDRGVGLPEGLDWTGSESMGLPMVSVLAQQIDGEMGVETRSGHTEFVIKFRKAKGT